MYHPLDALFQLQRALESRLDSEWLRDTTTGSGGFPPINVFQQGDNLVAILELAGVSRSDLDIQAKDNTIRIAGKKAVSYPENVSVHRRERLSGRRSCALHSARRKRQAALHRHQLGSLS
jgi:HSP20 family protein